MPEGTIEILVTRNRKRNRENFLCCKCVDQVCNCEGGFIEQEEAIYCVCDYLLGVYRNPANRTLPVAIWMREPGPWFVYRIDLGRAPNMNFISFCIDREGGNDGPVLG